MKAKIIVLSKVKKMIELWFFVEYLYFKFKLLY